MREIKKKCIYNLEYSFSIYRWLLKWMVFYCHTLYFFWLVSVFINLKHIWSMERILLFFFCFTKYQFKLYMIKKKWWWKEMAILKPKKMFQKISFSCTSPWYYKTYIKSGFMFYVQDLVTFPHKEFYFHSYRLVRFTGRVRIKYSGKIWKLICLSVSTVW